MKCKLKDCKDCAHFINIRTHPLFADFIIKDNSGKVVQFEGCVFHFQTMLLRQIWVNLGGVQAAVESGRNETLKGLGAIVQTQLHLSASNNEPLRLE